MTNKKLLLTCVISFLLFSITLIYTVNYHINHDSIHVSKAATKHHTKQKKQTETFTYTITNVTSEGYYGTAKDQTGVFLTRDMGSNLHLNKGNVIKVTFPVNDSETILNIEKLKGGSQNE